MNTSQNSLKIQNSKPFRAWLPKTNTLVPVTTAHFTTSELVRSDSTYELMKPWICLEGGGVIKYEQEPYILDRGTFYFVGDQQVYEQDLLRIQITTRKSTSKKPGCFVVIVGVVIYQSELMTFCLQEEKRTVPLLTYLLDPGLVSVNIVGHNHKSEVVKSVLD